MQLFLFLAFTGQLREERSLRRNRVRRGLSRGGYGSAVSGSAEGGHDPAVLRGSPVPPRARWHSLTMPESILLAWSLHAFLISGSSAPRAWAQLRLRLRSLGVCVSGQKQGDRGEFWVFLSFLEAIQAGGPNSCVPGEGRLRAGPFSATPCQ